MIVLDSSGVPPAHAAPSLADSVKLRLVQGTLRQGVADVGLVIEMQPGWHTYWRYPGDSGVPPEFATAGSQNVADIAVAYPAPRRFGDASDQTIGYEGTVVLPITVKLASPSTAGKLVLNARLGVCRQICLPVDETFTAELDPAMAPSTQDLALLAAARTALPKPVTAGDALSITGIRRKAEATPQTVSFAVKGATGQLDDVFVEGPEGWALPLPARVSGDGASSTWTFALDGLPAGAKPEGASLTFTIVSKAGATTQALVLQ